MDFHMPQKQKQNTHATFSFETSTLDDLRRLAFVRREKQSSIVRTAVKLYLLSLSAQDRAGF
jgi:hypothetical protein